MTERLTIAEKESRDIIQRFLRLEMSADDFCSHYTAFWMRFRDEQEKIKQTWPEPYDQQFVEARLRGELTEEEFGIRYAELWGITGMMDFCEMVDCIHSACSAFNPSPEQTWEINEEQLRTEVRQALTKYESGKGKPLQSH